MTQLKLEVVSFVQHEINSLKMQFLTNKVFPVNLLSLGKDSTCATSLSMVAWNEACKVKPLLRKLPFIVLNTDTKQENPVKKRYGNKQFNIIEKYALDNDIKLVIVKAEPNFINRWQGKVIGGNHTNFRADNTKGRQCAVMWKIDSAQKELSKWKKISKSLGYELLQILGSRFDESKSREENLNKVNAKGGEIIKVNGDLNYYPVYDWSVNDIWDYLLFCENDLKSKAPAIHDGFDETIRFYNNINAKECSFDAKDANTCQGRDGCVFCFASLDEDFDKELAENNPHIAGLMELRLFMLRNDTNYNNRNFIASKSKSGFVPHTPTSFSGKYLELLFGIGLTLQIREEERARKVKNLVDSGLYIETNGEAPLTEPQFVIFDIEDIVYINLSWMMRGVSLETNKALKIYNDIYNNGLRVEFPENFKTDNEVQKSFSEKGSVWVGNNKEGSKLIEKLPPSESRSWVINKSLARSVLNDEALLDKIIKIPKHDFFNAIANQFGTGLITPPNGQKTHIADKINTALSSYASGFNKISWKGGAFI